MYGDHGFSMVFREIKTKDDYEIENMQKRIMIEQVKKEILHLRIEKYINPIINVFQDFEEKNCMAILLGYGYSYTCDEKKRIDAVFTVNLNLSYIILKSFTTLAVPVLYCVGNCYDNSYVEKIRRGKSITLTYSLTGSNPRTDEYSWVTSSSTKIASSTIYSLFPKEKITLPKKEVGLRAEVPPHKILEAWTRSLERNLHQKERDE